MDDKLSAALGSADVEGMLNSARTFAAEVHLGMHSRESVLPVLVMYSGDAGRALCCGGSFVHLCILAAVFVMFCCV